jgi:putative ABC transport system permease protein
MVTHNPELADQYSTRIIRVLDGRVIGDSDPYDAGELSSAAAEPQADADAEPICKKAKKEKKKREKKRSMSFPTALALSLSNLMTKKGRTMLTSFAGSIGIIGIALILALSNGISTYISYVQEETLTSYPISIYREEPDISAMIGELMGDNSSSGEHPTDEDKIYSSAVFFNLLNAFLAPEMKTNNLRAFKEYLESGVLDGIDAILQYSYDLQLPIYTKGEGDRYVKADIMALMERFSSEMSNMGAGTGSDSSSESTGQGSSLSGNFSGYSVWSEALPGKGKELVSELLREQYDLIAGDWPTDKSHVLLVVDERNEVNDMTLYALGLKSQEEMIDYIMKAMSGEKIDVDAEVKSWDYDEILGLSFRLVLPADHYADLNRDNIYEDVSKNETVMKAIIEETGLELRVAGIIRPNPDAMSASANGTLLYTSALTEYMIEKTAESIAVIAQKNDRNTDIFTGLPFTVDPSTLPESVADRAKALRDYAASLSDAGKSELYRRILTTAPDSLIDAQLDAILSNFSDKEGIIDWVGAQYGSEAVSDILNDYLEKFTYDELIEMLSELLESNLRQSYAEAGEKAYRALRETPTDAELATIISQYIEPQFKTPAAKRMYIVGVYSTDTAIDAATLSAWAEGLDGEALDTVFRKAARGAAAEIYSQQQLPLVTDPVKDAKGAAALDAYLATLDDAAAAEHYTLFVPDGSAGVTYEDNLLRLGAVDIDSPSAINIYVMSFADKEKIAAVVEDYNEGVSEDDQISYTDYVGLVMSSVTIIIDAITYVLVAFVSISLVVSSIMIGIITYISVLERTKEIGILRAIGASKRDVSRVFNAETLLIGFGAGMIGILVTLLLCIPITMIIRALAGISNIGASLPFGAAVILVAISMGLTLIAGLLPARIAAKKDPVVALRTE